MRLAVTGAVRRMEPTVASVDLLATAYEPAALLDAFAEAAHGAAVRREAREAVVRRADGTPVSLHVLDVDDPSFFVQLAIRTGSAAHVRALEDRARSQGLELAPDGLYREGRRLEVPSEEALYDHLGLPWRPPELRADGELAPVPDDLVSMGDVRGLATLRAAPGSAFALADLVARAAQEGYAWVVTEASAQDVAAVPQDEDTPVRLFRAADLPAHAAIVEGAEPEADWHAAAQRRGERVLTCAAIERPSDVDRAICALAAARRGAWRRDDVLNTLEAEAFAAWCEAS